MDRRQASAYSASKLKGDRALMALDPDWVILRPSVVLGGPVFGASALIRGLAALPVLPVMPETGPLQGAALEDVAETVAFFVPPDRPARLALELAGPERLSFAQVGALHRAWLGWRPARPLALPGWWRACFTGRATWRAGWAGARRCAAPRGPRSATAPSATRRPGPS
ncbi:hypothetical protein [Paracoccus versutus]|uniref:hypothetical protein n=1 Tax=Paracoccus versutus TaxID=34007 RepID=UPI000E23AD87|nr:hypothetical protein [Paracoccus versutus]WGR56376.1 hypothetical protein E3U25_10535 [Paracoccus versutus]